MLPRDPEREDKPVPIGQGVSHLTGSLAPCRSQLTPMRYVVLVAEYPPGTLDGVSEDERFSDAKMPYGFSVSVVRVSKMLEEKKVSRRASERAGNT